MLGDLLSASLTCRQGGGTCGGQRVLHSLWPSKPCSLPGALIRKVAVTGLLRKITWEDSHVPTWNHCVLGFVPGTQYRLDELKGIISCCPNPDSGTPFLSPHSQHLGPRAIFLNTHHSVSRFPFPESPLPPTAWKTPNTGFRPPLLRHHTPPPRSPTRRQPTSTPAVAPVLLAVLPEVVLCSLSVLSLACGCSSLIAPCALRPAPSSAVNLTNSTLNIKLMTEGKCLGDWTEQTSGRVCRTEDRIGTCLWSATVSSAWQGKCRVQRTLPRDHCPFKSTALNTS